jgi:large subunit ribosomal protein L10e
MAKLRKGCSYRRLERPYTRRSKFRAKSFIRASPVCKVVRFDMGDPRKKFEYTVNLVSKEGVQIRHNALESARQASNRHLEESCGKTGFFLKLRPYPHHVLRENPLASGAGADRMSTGMQKSFGKAIGIAAQVHPGQIIFSACVDKQYLDVAKKALKKASYKMPVRTIIEVAQNPKQ